LGHTAISESARYCTTITSASSTRARIPKQPASNFFRVLVIADASVGVAHIDLIEFVMECLRIVHLAVKTA
jgi:hypothetical protein